MAYGGGGVVSCGRIAGIAVSGWSKDWDWDGANSGRFCVDVGSFVRERISISRRWASRIAGLVVASLSGVGDVNDCVDG